MKKMLLVLCALAVVLTGCAKTEKTASAAITGTDVLTNADGTVNDPDKVVISKGNLAFWSLFSGGDGTFMDKIIADYNAKSPKMPVQSVMLVWADYYTKLQTAVAAGKGPDIGVSHVSKLPELIDQGVVVPLDSYVKKTGLNLNDIYTQNSLDGVSSNGSIYAIPLDTHAEILYFNKDIMQKAGVALNSDGQLDISSAADFKAILDKVKNVMPEGTSPLSLTNSGDDPYRVWWATYFQMGGTPLVNDAGTAVTMDETIAVKAAEYVKSLYTDGYVLAGIDDHQAFFQNGKAGLAFCGTWATGALEMTENLNFGAQIFPKLFGNESCWADSHVFIIPVNKKRSEDSTAAAVDFIISAAKDGGATWAQSGQIPSNVDVLKSDAYLSLQYRSGYMQALDTAVLPVKHVNFGSMKIGIIDSLNAYWTNQTDAKTAIANVKNELNLNLD